MDKNVDDLISAYVESGGRADAWVQSWRKEMQNTIKPSYNISPTTMIAVVREGLDGSKRSRRRLDAAVWDLRPHWRTRLGKPMINARLETVAEKPMWRDAFARRRLLVPMRGYFEWTGPAKARQPHFIHHPQAALLSAAGLGEVRNVNTDEGPHWEVSAAIITAEARDAAGDVHERMPVFLEASQWDQWLDPEALDRVGKLSMLNLLHEARDRLSPYMRTHAIATTVNRAGAGADDPATITQI